MRKIWALVVAFSLSLIISNFASATEPNLYLSRISQTNGDEFVEIFNASNQDFYFSNLILTSGALSKQFLSAENIIIPANSYFVIRNNPAKPNNLYFAKDAINGKARVGLFDGENLIDFICADSAANCAKEGFEKNASETKSNQIFVAKNEYLKDNLAPKNNKYQFVLAESNERYAQDFFGRNLAPEEDEKNPQEDDSAQEEPVEEPQNPPAPANPSEKNEDEKPEIVPPAKPETPNFCEFLRITEVFVNAPENERFIEIRNFSNEVRNFENCKIQTNKSGSKNHIFSNLTLNPGEFHTIKIAETGLKVNKTTAFEIYLLDAQDNEIEKVAVSKTGAGTSWALFENGWKQTFSPTPNQLNVFEEFAPCGENEIRAQNGKCEKKSTKSTAKTAAAKTCEAGYYLNPETNRCNKISAKTESKIAECKAGYYRNPATNRCNKIAAQTSAPTPCKAGYYRNPETNRCRKIAAETTELVPCKDGYERNPETNRCRKIAKNNGADFAVEAEKSAEEIANKFNGWWVILGVAAVFLLVLAWEFRQKIGIFLTRIFRRGKK
ncbi:MAG: lamin tail domain-containing protein [bacterium]|nr:lamin tail domain-containing protein [bacterium]